MKTNFEHLQSLNVRSMALAIWNYASDYCAYCPKNMERRCNENCRAGIREWLNSPYIPSSDIWKKRGKAHEYSGKESWAKVSRRQHLEKGLYDGHGGRQ